MPSVFNKLNLKDQAEILVVDAPESFEPELAALSGVRVLREPGEAQQIAFALFFVTTLAAIAAAAELVARQAPGDPVIWFAYPKASSKRYRCGFNRDTGWQALGDAGFEGVRQVAIDEDWSALRFRRVAYIKSLTRRKGMALSEEGKARTVGE